MRPEDCNIENVQIHDVELSMANNGCLTLTLVLRGSATVYSYGAFTIGHGCINADQWDAHGIGLVVMMKIMDVVGVDRWDKLQSQYCRIKTSNSGATIYCIGNIIYDKWFDVNEFICRTSDDDKYYLDERSNIDTYEFHGTAYPD